MPSGTDTYDGVSGSQARTSKDCHSQAPTSSPRDLGPTTVAAPEARPTRRAPRTAMTAWCARLSRPRWLNLCVARMVLPRRVCALIRAARLFFDHLMTGCLPVSWAVILTDGAATSGTDSTGTVAALRNSWCQRRYRGIRPRRTDVLAGLPARCNPHSYLCGEYSWQRDGDQHSN